MAEPVRRSPLAGLALAARSVPGPEPVTLAALPFRGKLIVRGGADAQKRAADVLGLDLPGPLRGHVRDEMAALWLGPDEWLVLLASGTEEQRAEVLRARLAGCHHAVVVVSDRMCGIAVEGTRAREVLNAGCALDLHDDAFPPGTATRTLLGKAPIVLWRTECGGFELWVNGSLAPYAWQFLENAALEYGFAITA